jgi:hypothetical protein
MKPYSDNQLKSAATVAGVDVSRKGLSETEQRYEMFYKGAEFAMREYEIELKSLQAQYDILLLESSRLKDKIVKLTSNTQ